MEFFIAALAWIVYLVMELRQEILTAFAYADAPLILLALILYLRVRRLRRKKEQSDMWGRKTAEEELFGALIEAAQPAVKAAEEAVPMIEYALAELPDLDDEGEVRRFREVLSSSSKELRKQLKVAIGPETIRGVKKCIKRIWDAIDKTEDIRLRAKLLKDAHAFAVASAVANHRLSSEGFRQIKKNHEESVKAIGIEGADQLTDENWAYAYSRLTMVSTGALYATAAGMKEVPHEPLTGEQLLSEPPGGFVALPRPKVEIVDDDPEEISEGGFFSNGSHPMDRLSDE